ncbi:hypothetical protein [Pseudobacteriovorax antillogorgiicola]|uniref:Uncharacterized protein n=1 Tax=Pseudobacteriovorax antillogorgiicola TaxID=1513793 RepID=A0A1Y6CNV3_9BACT|nr:hypothetical protein [Pseudobacteriovorax antillogorgiicola]TCS44780.1 hypothetical protein EDD56_1319 [Pseudobacteriovorax antillogorgiicola]SMF77509.1 hypothetical protein SAMN06296036_13155 [Pseudobacteriovorax antillogorgiicola]
MNWATIADYQLKDFMMVSVEVYEALHQAYLNENWPFQLIFLIVLAIQMAMIPRYRIPTLIVLSLVWIFLAWVYMAQTLGQVIWLGETLAWLCTAQALLILGSSILTKVDESDGTRPSMHLKALVFLIVSVPWEALISGQWSLSQSYGLGVLSSVSASIAITWLTLKSGKTRLILLIIPFALLLFQCFLLYGLYFNSVS